MQTQKTKFINFRPAVILTAGFIFGILLGYAFTFISKQVAVITFIVTALSLIVTAVLLLAKRLRNIGCFIVAILAIVILGASLLRIDAKVNYEGEGEFCFSGVVSEIYTETKTIDGYYYSMIVKGSVFDYDKVKVYSSFTSAERIYQGSKISFNANFVLNDEDFSFSSGASYTANVDVSTLKVGGLYGIIPTLKFKLLTTLEEFMPKTFYLNYALITGETSYIPEYKIVKYQNIGVSHLFAVSGLHIGLTYGVLIFILKRLKVKSKVRFPVIFTILLCYVGFCGFSASSMRAFVIITIRELAKLIGEKPDKTTNLSLSALVVLAINPSDLFSVGFLLSYTVYLGLILLSSPFEKMLSKVFPEKISKVLSPCIVAELVSIPILIDFFGKCSVFGFLFNAFIIPIVSVLYPLIVLSVLLLCVFQVGVFAVLPNLAFGLIDFSLSKITTDIFILSNFKFSFAVVPCYILAYSFAGKLNFGEKTLRVLRIIVLLVSVLTFCAVNF